MSQYTRPSTSNYKYYEDWKKAYDAYFLSAYPNSSNNSTYNSNFSNISNINHSYDGSNNSNGKFKIFILLNINQTGLPFISFIF